MNVFSITLFIAGLFFPVLSLLTGIGSIVGRRRHGKHSSPVFVPFIGPILLTCSILSAEKSLWLVPVVWILDIGTVAFLATSPRLLAEWWRVSAFTRILTLRGHRNVQSAVVTLHSTGYYLLKKSWRRAAGELGIVGLGESGTFTGTDDGYDLTSYLGLHRTLRKIDSGEYRVSEELPLPEDFRVYSLEGWLLEIKSGNATPNSSPAN